MTSRLDLEPWPWQPELCPADEQFIEWLMQNKRQPWMAGTVFHMGPGEHHRVPRTCEALGLECISITVSEGEMLMMPHFISYRCLLQNIWDLDPATLPEIHFMTIFHFGEMAGEYGEIDYDKMDALIRRVAVGGKVFFYSHSAARDRQIGYFNHAWLDARILSYHAGQYKSLVIAERI